ncbi:hypothetical protein M758_2G228500 [Ceratodon purpureus]|nr:hypothetical protein M758_2G228500 [Ceratodon purpureus]
MTPFAASGTISRGRSMGDNGSAEEKSLSGDPWGQLGDDMLVYILARLPLSPLKACKQVCKRWQAVTNSPEFDILHKQLGEQQPRLVCYRTNHLVRSKSQAFAYDEESRTWVTLPPMQFPSHNHGSLAGASGLVYAIAGPGDNKLTYKLTRSPSSPSSFLETWCKTPVMGFARHAPVVSVALGTGRTGSGHKVVVAGGVPDYEPDHMAVEVFDSETGKCIAFPHKLTYQLVFSTSGLLTKESAEFCSRFNSDFVISARIYVDIAIRRPTFMSSADNFFPAAISHRKLIISSLLYLFVVETTSFVCERPSWRLTS